MFFATNTMTQTSFRRKDSQAIRTTFLKTLSQALVMLFLGCLSSEQERLFCFGFFSILLLLVGCLTPQQQASVFQGRICSDNCICCHTEVELADQTISPSHSILTPGQPVPPPTLYRQSRVAIRVPIVKSLV